jgi:hypothetical protein
VPERVARLRNRSVDARPWLEQLEGADDAGLLAGLAFLAAQDVTIPEVELNAARRRALFVLAAGGDPHRALEPGGRAARALAADLDSPDRRADAARALDRLAAQADGLAAVTAALERLRADSELGWRWLACALLAEELAESEEE